MFRLSLLGLGSLLSSRLLGSRFLGSLLSSRLLGSLLSSWLLGLLGSWLLSSLRLLSLGLLGLRLLSLGLLSRQFEGPSSLLASSSGRHQLLGSEHLLESQTDTDGGLSSVDLVVGHDVLEDGLAGGTLLVCQLLDGSCDHGGVGRVGSSYLGLGSLLGLGSSSRHDEDVLA